MSNNIATRTKTYTRRYPFLIDLIIRMAKQKPMGMIGLIIVVGLLLIGIFADFIAPYGMTEVHPEDAFSPPSPRYILGTDLLGRDLLSRIIYGARISMVVGLSGSVLCSIIAVIIGITSGLFGGKIDIVLQRFVDAVMCFPSIFLYLTVMSILGRGIVQVILVLGVLAGIRNSRIIRSAVISSKENVYVQAATSIGASTNRILYSHILPNVAAPIIVIFTIEVGAIILAESTISFLGFGIPPPIPSWGSLLSREGRSYMIKAPWLALWPGVVLSIAVYGINMLGDAVRDLLDPRLRGGIGRYDKLNQKKVAEKTIPQN